MANAIDVERGVVSRLHQVAGFRVYMYYDDPGYYYNEHGHPLAEQFAEEAGFPIKDHAKDRYKREKMKDFAAQMNTAMAEAEDAEDKEVLKERGEFKVLAMPYEQAIVVDGQGNKLTPLPVARLAAYGLLDHLMPEGPAKTAKKGKGE